MINNIMSTSGISSIKPFPFLCEPNYETKCSGSDTPAPVNQFYIVDVCGHSPKKRPEVSIFTWGVLALQQIRIFSNSIQQKWLKLDKTPAISG